ncbi:MAG: type III pantothenate kinase [Planctomycetota bacterium]|jgi:type III pantothenate kinase
MQESNPNEVPLIAMSIGNSRCWYALCHGRDVGVVRTASLDDEAGVFDGIREMLPTATSTIPVVCASVNDSGGSGLLESLERDEGITMYRVGLDVEIPLRHTLADDNTTGIDRFLAAMACFDVCEQACVVVDAGTAVTVDFVDGEGTYQGGCILPGAQMMLDALHERTSALPALSLEKPSDEVFPATTRQSMLSGVTRAIRGAVRHISEGYALEYGAFPTVIATGGDAELLFGDDELVERVVPDLVLRGIARCAADALTHNE